MLIERFRHKGLRRRYDDDDPSGLPAELVAKIKAILAALESAARSPAGGHDAGLETAPA
jgi:proteic killer suppression protein